jgi:xanthine dehydrogenase molybdenum-binding subunit
MPSPKSKPAQQEFGAKYKLIGKDYTTPDLYAKVTGKSKYAEDYRADGMLFCKLLLSPVPHGRVKHLDLSKALAMPGVKAILTQDDLPAPADSVTDLGVVIKANHGADLPGRAYSGGGCGGRTDGRRGHRKN